MKIKGIGGAPRYKIFAKKGDVWLIPGDLHFPIHDAKAVDAMVRWFDATYPGHSRGVLCQGDTFDSHSISRFPKKPERLAAFPSLVAEAATARKFLKHAGAQKNGCVVIPGNHEDWLDDLIMSSPGLSGAPGMDWPKLTGLDDIEGVQWLPYGTKVLLGDLVVVCHGDPRDFPKKCHLVVNKYPDQFTIFGHTHQAASFYRTVYDSKGRPQTRGAMNVGTLSQQAEYTDDPNHQLAFATVEFFGDRGNGAPFFRALLHHIVRDKRGGVHVA